MDHSTYAGKRVLVTGGLGFVGSHLAERLVRLGADVTIVDSLIPEYGGNLFNVREIADEVRVNLSDIRDPWSIRQLVRGQDFLFNLAGQVSHVDSMEDPQTDLDINCKSQLALLEVCRRVNPSAVVVFAASRQQYGRPQFVPVTEDHPLVPVDVNGINLIAGHPENIGGWAVPIATDIAFALAVLAVLSTHLPTALVNPTSSLENSHGVQSRLAHLRGKLRFDLGAATASAHMPKPGKLPVLGSAPDFASSGPWLNTGGRTLSLAQLRVGATVPATLMVGRQRFSIRPRPRAVRWYSNRGGCSL